MPLRRGTTSSANDAEIWDLHNLANARRLCDFQFEQVPDAADGRVLEVGAGIGTFSERLLVSGARELLLIEPEAACVGELRRRFANDPRVEVAAESLPDVPSLAGREGSFDLVVSQNVFEHIADDRAAVAAVAQALRPGGRLMTLVPAHPRLYGSLDRAYGHHRRYTRERLRSVVESAGLEIERLYSFNALGILGWWARSRMGRKGIGSSPLKVYEALLLAWRPIERRLNLPVGLSLVVHARRPLEGPDA
jgi:SAM-dependent methyltransferase